MAVFFMFAAITFAQKKEIKKADRELSKENYSQALLELDAAEKLLGAADNETRAWFYIVKGEALMGAANKTNYGQLKSSAEALLKAEELDTKHTYKERLVAAKNNLRVELVNSAIDDQNKTNYDLAADKLVNAYNVSKADTSYLYYAAGNLVNGKHYNEALKLYEQLMELGFTGVQMQYLAANKETGKEDMFGSKEERDMAVKYGTYVSPVDRMSQSVLPDILQKLTLIYIQNGDNEKAVAVMKKAREANPDDTALMRSEADLAYKMGDMKKYNEVMEQIVKSDPNNPELYYNLGVSATQVGELEKAKSYYLKALELRPNYSFALINMAGTILQNEGKIIEEMNGLGNSAADNKRYDELKEQRKKMYEEALPYLERASETAPDNVEVVRTMMNMYSQLGMNDKFKATKARLESMEN